MRSRWMRVGTILVVVAAMVAGSSTIVVASERPALAGGCTDPFTASFRQALADEYPGQRVTASVYDTRTGCWSDLSPGMAITTASVIKAQFLAGVLLRAQDQGRSTTAWERQRIDPMITYSHNPPASDLFVSLGGVAGQEALDNRFGLGATTSTSTWGATVSTAQDRTKLALALLHGGGPLGSAKRSEAWASMTSVHPTQQWGITAGVPGGWTVALKNGFYPASGTARWRIGSTGFVRNDSSGQGYAITVMTDRNPDHETGQRLVERVSKRVASTLTSGDAAARPVDRSVCTRTSGSESWASVAGRLGTSDAAGVRTVSGGPSSPLTGMRACRPTLSVVYDADGPTADFVRAAFRTFLGRTPSASELRTRTVAIDGGTRSRGELTTELSRSLEWISRTVGALYESALGREADTTGLRYWRDQIAGGMRVTDVGAYFYASSEFYAQSGNRNPGFVDRLYREVLHRGAEGAGRAYWLGQLEAGVPRIVVTSSFYASVESRRDRVTRTYRAVLGRAPDAGGLAYWSEQLLRVDDVDLAAYLAASTEFFQRSQR